MWRSHRLGLTVGVFCVVQRLFAGAAAPAASYGGPLFDAHAHIVRGGGPAQPAAPTTTRTSLTDLFAQFRTQHVDGVYLFAPSTVALEARRADPTYVVAFAEPPIDRQRQQLQFDDSTVGVLEQQLKAGVTGIGEIPMRHQPTFKGSYRGYAADGPIALAVYDLAARYHVPVNIHVEHSYSAELDRALAHNRQARIIWAHVGDGPPALVRDLMRKHQNLYADISTRNPYMKQSKPAAERLLTGENGAIQTPWKAVFEEFPDRFMFGLDINTPDRVAALGDIVAYYRSVLGQLSTATAEKIAGKNARALVAPAHSSQRSIR